jgi:shikimate dehydrogenase
MIAIDGNTRLIAHIGDPTATFKSPMIYNPYFAHLGINAAVVPMGVRDSDYETSLKAIFRFTNILGALITMPHKVSTVALLDESSVAVQIAGSCNALRPGPGGTLVGDIFDGEGFVRGLRRRAHLPVRCQWDCRRCARRPPAPALSKSRRHHRQQ